MLALHFSSFNPFQPTLSLARGTNRQFYSTGMIFITKLDIIVLFLLTDKDLCILKWHQILVILPH